MAPILSPRTIKATICFTQLYWTVTSCSSLSCCINLISQLTFRINKDTPA